MVFADLREKVNQNRNGAVALISVLLVASVVLGWRWLRPGPKTGKPTSYYFYDTANDQLSTAPANRLPPQIGATGKPTLVRAVMLTCTGCGDRRLAYLLKYTAAAKKARRLLDQPPAASAPPALAADYASRLSDRKLQVSEGTLVRLPAQGSPWVLAMSAAGATLIHNARHCPDGTFAQACNP